MAKVSNQDITDLGFTEQMFEKETAEFTAMIDGIINEQADLLEGRIGSAAYNDTNKPMATYVKRAEKCMVAAEMVQGRIIKIAGNAIPDGEEPVTRSLDEQKRKYLDESEKWITKILAGSNADSDDFSSGVVISSPLNRSDFLNNQKEYDRYQN